MRKTRKINTKNKSKTRQKTSKNTPKKHNENTTTHFQPKGRQKVHIKRPTREGKGGIQDGILLEKKRILQKPDLLRGKGACWKGKPQTLRRSTRSAGGLRPARGRISVACGNSSAPGPREDSLHAKICKKFDTRVNAGYFLKISA